MRLSSELRQTHFARIVGHHQRVSSASGRCASTGKARHRIVRLKSVGIVANHFLKNKRNLGENDLEPIETFCVFQS